MDKLELFLSLETSESAHIGDRAHVPSAAHAEVTLCSPSCRGYSVPSLTVNNSTHLA